jgi:protoporphyrin/coproporphyrin ferrochelatase
MATGPGIGVLLLQLGTPEAATPSAVRRYLREFLLDRRVVDLPRPLWWPILHGIVLRTRPARSARLYQRVWTEEGSPLAITSRAQAEGLARLLNAEDVAGAPPVHVAVAMRYGSPSIDAAVDTLLAAGCDRLLAFPMYPQYAGATTGSSLERLFESLGRRRVVPSVRVLPPYYDDAAYIRALTASIRVEFEKWPAHHLLLSFHGLPRRYAEAGDPYREHCEATAQAVARELGWPPEQLTVSFQSRFGREEWLRPYTDEVLRELASRRIPRLAVACPGFTADCLETLEEIGITGREQYHEAGGGDYRVIPCLNANDPWIDAMASLASRELAGWRATGAGSS